MRWAVALVALSAALAGVRWQQEREVAAWRAHAGELGEGRAGDGVITVNGNWHLHSSETGNAAAPTMLGPAAPRLPAVPEALGDPIAAIVDFDRRLAAEGIDLIVLPAPARHYVHPALFGFQSGWIPATRRQYARPHNEVVRALRAEGVETLDIVPELQKLARSNVDKWVHRGDQHWTNDAVVLAARRVAERIADRPWQDELRPLATSADWRRIARMAPIGLDGGVKMPREQIRVRKIRTADGQPLPMRFVGSPITVIGDSNVGWYTNFEGDFTRQLTHELGAGVDLLAVHGGGATRCREELIYEMATVDGYRSSRRLVVWVFMMEQTLRGAWGITPLTPPPPTRLELREAHASSDLAVVDRGAGGAFDPRWAGRRDGMRWLKGLWGTLRFEVWDPDRRIAMVLGIQTSSPPGAEPQALVVELNDTALGRWTLGDGHTEIRIPLERGTLREGANELKLAARRYSDRRNFSIAVASVTLSTQGASP